MCNLQKSKWHKFVARQLKREALGLGFLGHSLETLGLLPSKELHC
jgi:hypothetical protein